MDDTGQHQQCIGADIAFASLLLRGQFCFGVRLVYELVKALYRKPDDQQAQQFVEQVLFANEQPFDEHGTKDAQCHDHHDLGQLFPGDLFVVAHKNIHAGEDGQHI